MGQYQQYALKKEMRAKIKTTISSSETEQFVFTLAYGKINAPSFYWEDAQEFSYRGEMYDVIETKTADGKLYITCINDSKEKELISRMTDITKNQNNKPAKNGSTIQLMLCLLFIQPASFTLLAPYSATASPRDFYKVSFCSACKEIITPPPQA